MTLSEARAQIEAGVEIVEEWPHRFFDALDQHRFRMAGDRGTQLLVEAFPRLPELCNLMPGEAWRHRIQEAVNNYCSESLSSPAPIVGRNAVLCTGPMTIKQVATRLGRRVESVISAIDGRGDAGCGVRVTAQGRLRRVVSEEDLPKLSALLMDAIELKKASRLIALPASRVLAMVHGELLSMMDGRLSRGQVLALGTYRYASDGACTDARVDFVPVRAALRKWIRVEDTAAFTRALLGGAPRLIAPTAACPMGECLISILEAEAWAQQHRSKPGGTLTLTDSARALGLKYDVVRDLIQAGLLKADFKAGQGRRSWCVTRADLEAFRSRYVALVVLTKEAGVRARDGPRWARAQQLRVVTGPDVDGSRQYFVDRGAHERPAPSTARQTRRCCALAI